MSIVSYSTSTANINNNYNYSDNNNSDDDGENLQTAFILGVHQRIYFTDKFEQ